MISIIIPNFDGLEHLKTCFSSIEKQNFRNFKVVLADNGSSDESVKFTEENYPEYKIIRFKINTGFAKAVNAGIMYAINEYKPEIILLLNNDTELGPDFLEKGYEAFKNPEVSFAAVKMMNFYNRDIIDDAGDFVKQNGGSPFARGHGEIDKGMYYKSEWIFGACAGAAFYRTKVFNECGIFDEDFFAYYEDIDFSFRAQLEGFKCLYIPECICYHKRGGTISTYGFQTEMCERNLVMMRFKNYPLSMYILYQPLFLTARAKRYYGFFKNNSAGLVFKALRGYLRGLMNVPGKAAERFKIQKKRKVSVHDIKSLFR